MIVCCPHHYSVFPSCARNEALYCIIYTSYLHLSEISYFIRSSQFAPVLYIL